ncbi:MAG: hypothetical protein U0800_00620 [Isosphaeraceae bacterium]
MSYLRDMRALEGGEVAVGWLHPDHPFPQADPAPAFLAKLKDYAGRASASARALSLGAAGGYHTWEFCGQAYGTTNFGVPAGERLYCSPEMIAHDVDRHRYAPPAELVAALMASPLPGTREYVDAVAPFVGRQRALRMVDATSVPLERHVAIVLYECLTRLADATEFEAEGRAERVAVWTMLGELGSILAEPFDPRYEDLLERARRPTRNSGKEEADRDG